LKAVRRLRVLPDGSHIAFEFTAAEHSEIYAVAVAGGRPRPLPTLPGADNVAPSWSRDVRAGKTKQSYCFEVNDGELFVFAGLWERWKDPSGKWIKSCSILTTTPNAVTAEVHDRMPVILHPDTYDPWLDPGFSEVAAVSKMLKPYDALLMRSYPVSNRINHAANDDPDCSAPVAVESPSQGQLF
jgi:hypothetical protein